MKLKNTLLTITGAFLANCAIAQMNTDNLANDNLPLQKGEKRSLFDQASYGTDFKKGQAKFEIWKTSSGCIPSTFTTTDEAYFKYKKELVSSVYVNNVTQLIQPVDKKTVKKKDLHDMPSIERFIKTIPGCNQ